MRILVSNVHLMEDWDRFKGIFEDRGIEVVLPPVNERLSEDELLQLITDIDGIICGDDAITAKVLAHANSLKVISKWGTGIDSIDKDACDDLGILLYNTPNAFTNPVADTTMGFILAISRRIVDANTYMHSGIWKKLPGKALNELTLGIIGVGNIGKAVARRAHVFGMTLLGNDPVEMPTEFLWQTDMEMVSKTRLLQESDFVSLHCDLNPTSRLVINRDDIVLMKPTAYLINTARGPLVNEVALILALQQGWIAGAGLDVFENEPLNPDSVLIGMENVLLSSHNANTGYSAREAVHISTINNLFRGLGCETE